MEPTRKGGGVPYYPRHLPYLEGLNDADVELIPLTMRPWKDITKDEAASLCERVLEHALKLEGKVLASVATSKLNNPRLWEKIQIYFQASNFSSFNLCDLILSPQIPNKGIFVSSEEDVPVFISLCKNLYALGLSFHNGELTMNEPRINLTSPPPRPYNTMTLSQVEEDMSASPPNHPMIGTADNMHSANMMPPQPDTTTPSSPPSSPKSQETTSKRSRKRKKEQSKDSVYNHGMETSSTTIGTFELRSLQGEVIDELLPVGDNSSVATFYVAIPWNGISQLDRHDVTDDLPTQAKNSLMRSETWNGMEDKPSSPNTAITVEFYYLQNRNTLSKRDAPTDNPLVWTFASALMGGNFTRWRTIVNEREVALKKIQQEISIQASSFVARQSHRPAVDYKVLCPNAHEVLRNPNAHPTFASLWTTTRNQILKWDEEISKIEISNSDAYARIAEERRSSKAKEMKEDALIKLKSNFLTASTKMLSNSFGTRQRPKAPHFVFSFESRQLRPDYQEMKRALSAAGATIKGSAHLWAIGADFLGECHPGVNAKDFVESLSHRIGDIAKALGRTIYFKDNAQQDKVQIILRNISPSTPFSQIKTVLVDFLGIKLDEILSCNWMRSSVDFIVLPSLQISLSKAPIAFVLMDYFESKRIRENPELSVKDKRLFFRVGGVSWFWEWSAGDRKYAPECHYCGCPHTNSQCPLPSHRPDLWGEGAARDHGSFDCSEESAKSLLKLADEPIEPAMKVAKPPQHQSQSTSPESTKPMPSKPSWNMVARGRPSTLNSGASTRGDTAKTPASAPGTTINNQSADGLNLRAGTQSPQDQTYARTQADPTPAEAFVTSRSKKRMNTNSKAGKSPGRYDDLEHEEVDATSNPSGKTVTSHPEPGTSNPKKKRDTNALFVSEKERTMLDLTDDNSEEECLPPRERGANQASTPSSPPVSSKNQQISKATRSSTTPCEQDSPLSGFSPTSQEAHGRPAPARCNPSGPSLEARVLSEARTTLDKLTSHAKEERSLFSPTRPWDTLPSSSASATGKRTEWNELEGDRLEVDQMERTPTAPESLSRNQITS